MGGWRTHRYYGHFYNTQSSNMKSQEIIFIIIEIINDAYNIKYNKSYIKSVRLVVSGVPIFVCIFKLCIYFYR